MMNPELGRDGDLGMGISVFVPLFGLQPNPKILGWPRSRDHRPVGFLRRSNQRGGTAVRFSSRPQLLKVSSGSVSFAQGVYGLGTFGSAGRSTRSDRVSVEVIAVSTLAATPTRALDPRASTHGRRVGVALLLVGGLVAFGLAPTRIPDSYSWVEHGISESAGQGIDGARVARAGFILYGLAVIRLVGLRSLFGDRSARCVISASGCRCSPSLPSRPSGGMTAPATWSPRKSFTASLPPSWDSASSLALSPS